MPSPIGHALAGLATAWTLVPAVATPGAGSTASQTTANRTVSTRTLTLTCVGLALAPDLDLLYLPVHRMGTHSVSAVLLVMIIAAGVTGWVTGRIEWRITCACGVAYGSHILLDWLGADASRPYGIQALWPLSDRWFVSPWAIFPGTERRAPFSARTLSINFRAALVELGLMGTVALAAWLGRCRVRERSLRRGRLSSESTPSRDRSS